MRPFASAFFIFWASLGTAAPWSGNYDVAKACSFAVAELDEKRLVVLRALDAASLKQEVFDEIDSKYAENSRVFSIVAGPNAQIVLKNISVMSFKYRVCQSSQSCNWEEYKTSALELLGDLFEACRKDFRGN